ncbi:GNAT family N-acetyltransferase [Kitasatospora sp. NPDC052896]|uniref:GNAT family N-acetyltransferase n=1 Tax=Kitasatospora sp. NPDC052896 TaxID=3364061 RepID=UPI0037C53599
MSSVTSVEQDAGEADGIEIRVVGEDELAAWGAAVSVGFLRAGLPDAPEFRRLRQFPERTVGAFDGERIVGTFRSFPTELTLPGGALLPVSAITGVTVHPTHRRRGLLTRMMTRELAAARDRGEAVAILIAAEYGIYGRFGFGPATRHHGWRVDLSRTRGLRPGLPTVPGGRLDLIDMAELGKLGPELHERWRRGRPGAIARDAAFWKPLTGEMTMPGREWKEPFAVVHRDAAGTVTGLAVYRVDDNWAGPVPDNTLTVRDFLALDPPTEVALWRYLLSVDWVRHVTVPNIAPDDPLPLLLADPRAARPYEDDCDFVWLRVLDVPAAFGARTYGAPGRVVLDVADPDGHAAGRWALEVDPTGTGRVTRTDDPADLALGAAELGRLYLGAETAPRLAAAALVTELRRGAAQALDLLLRTPLRAWNPDGF